MKEEIYTPQSIDTTGVELFPKLIVLGKKITKNMHDVRSLGRFKKSWTYGYERNCINKKYPCLVQRETARVRKKYGRKTAQETLRVIMKLEEGKR